ncbi:hypothetical protein HUN27_03965 [Agrobacterium tumefaciens]|nr:hypothetical protein [Agrobacterium tumefaciens]
MANGTKGVDFSFWDGCLRLRQAGKSGKKTSKKLHFFWKKVLRVDFRAVDDLIKGVTCSAAFILFAEYGGPICRTAVPGSYVFRPAR